MEYNLKTRVYDKQEALVAKQGDTIWELFCDNLPCNTPFTLDEATTVLVNNLDLGVYTAKQYSRVILHNIAAQSPQGCRPLSKALSPKVWAFV